MITLLIIAYVIISLIASVVATFDSEDIYGRVYAEGLTGFAALRKGFLFAPKAILAMAVTALAAVILMNGVLFILMAIEWIYLNMP